MKIQTLDIDELNERLEELEALRDALDSERENLDNAQTTLDDMDEEATEEDLTAAQKAVEEAEGRVAAAESDFGEEEQRELKELQELLDSIGPSDGPFIHEDGFKEYAQELAEDIGAIDPRASWPLNCIDWDQAAEELKSDYSTVEFRGNTYYYRE